MKTLFIVLCLAAGLFASPLAKAQPPIGGFPASPERRKENLVGAYERAYDRLYFLNRQMDFDRENTGLNGRKNSTRDEMRRAETPELAPAPFGDR